MLDLRKNLVERRMVELDPSLAQHYLKYNNYESQRSIRPVHAETLAEKMRNGLFRFGEVAFACRNGDGDTMINGQHTCQAVIDSGVTVPVMLEKFKVTSKLELSELFRQFEILPRSLGDMIRVESDSLNLTWPLRLSSLIVASATLKEKGNARNSGGYGAVSPSRKYAFSKEYKVKLLGKYLKEGAFLSEILTDSSRSKHLFIAACGYMMFETYAVDQKAAKRFWMDVRDGEFLSADSPQMKLRNFLMLRLVSKSNKQISNHEICTRIAHAWNAFRKGTSTNLSYYPSKPIPKLK